MFELSLDRVHHATGLLQELLARSPGRALELTPHVVDLSRHILTIEHPGADLDRVDHGPAGFLAAVRPLANDPRGALVGDGEALDHQAVVERTDDAVTVFGRLIDGWLWLLGRFHGDSRK